MVMDFLVFFELKIVKISWNFWKILIVDDDFDVYEVICIVVVGCEFESCGFELLYVLLVYEVW